MSPARKVPLICLIVNNVYGVNVVEKSFLSLNKEARLMAMLLVRKHTTYSFSWISEYFSISDVHNTLARFEARIQVEKSLSLRYSRLETILIHKVKDSNNARLSDTDLTTTLF